MRLVDRCYALLAVASKVVSCKSQAYELRPRQRSAISGEA